MGLGLPEILLILLVVVILFGAGKLPRVMEDMGKGMKAFKKGMNDADEKPQDKPVAKRTENDTTIIDQ